MNSRLNKSIPVISCPHCEQPFRLPDQVDVNAEIECPHCDKDLQVSVLLDKVIPTARVKDSGQSEAGESPQVEAIAPISRPFDESEDYVIPKPLKTAIRHHSRNPDPKHRESRRKRRDIKRKRAIDKKTDWNDWIRIVLGAFIAMPIAQLVLWWAFAMDPFNLAPYVKNHAPFFVPPALRDDAYRESVEIPKNLDLPATQQLHDEQKIPTLIND